MLLTKARAMARNRSHILVVDDELAVREITTETLRQIGYRVTPCADGVEALACFTDKGDVDLLVLDLVMPRLSGIDTLRELRQQGHDVPTIVVTGYADEPTCRTLQNLGIFRLLSKPFRLAELALAVEKALATEDC
jgi:CheY-like chemotaxis protein